MTHADASEKLYERSSSNINVGDKERMVSVLAGAGLLLLGLGRGRITSALLGAAAGGPLLYRGITGHCPVSASLGIDTAHREDSTSTYDDDPYCRDCAEYHDRAEDIVTESSMESFPASDPPSSY